MTETTITISGPTGCGKTTLLHVIGAALQSLNIPVSCQDDLGSTPVDQRGADSEASRYLARRKNNPVFIQTQLTDPQASKLSAEQQALIDQSIASLTVQLVKKNTDEDEIDASVDQLRGLLNQYFTEAQ